MPREKTPGDETGEPGADIMPDTPSPTLPGETPRTETENIEEEGEPFGENFV